jgi:hypothetical protein
MKVLKARKLIRFTGFGCFPHSIVPKIFLPVHFPVYWVVCLLMAYEDSDLRPVYILHLRCLWLRLPMQYFSLIDHIITTDWIPHEAWTHYFPMQSYSAGAGLVTRLRAGRSEVHFSARVRDYFSLQMSRPAVGTSRPSTQWMRWFLPLRQISRGLQLSLSST